MTERVHKRREPAFVPCLNYSAIRDRATELGLTGARLDTAIGIGLQVLQNDRDQRSVSLAVLARLTRVLGLTPNELLILDSGPPQLEAEPGPRGCDDAVLLLALAVAHDGIDIDLVLHHCGWSHERLEQAVAALGVQLSPTALAVVCTDHRVSVVLRPGALPSHIREKFTDRAFLRQPLTPHEAVNLHKLLRKNLLAPFPDPASVGEKLTSATGGDPVQSLIDRRIAVSRSEHSGTDSPRDRLGALDIHPDSLFALGFSQRPELHW
ncbi:helix-turn-helix domain-containing protein [Nocardia ignorata]|uniref:helix-turn-helix domain-containing protein n=1 Tax=Nocardia ignorata TaxID=145285 RepID=UPI000837165A|nr:helix-turn-helix transcriptional regulator [Nocardia ignorata]